MRPDLPTVAKWIARALALAFALAIAAWALRPAVGQTALTLPSGRGVELFDLRADPEGMRFRFLAEGIAGMDPAEIEMEMAALCQLVVLPALAEAGQGVDVVILSLSSERLEFGTTNPAVTQFFEMFRIADGTCMLEEY